MIGGMWVVSLLGNETSTNIPNNLTRLLGCCFLKKIFTLFQKKKVDSSTIFCLVIKKRMPGTNAGLFMINTFNSSNRSEWLTDMVCWLHLHWATSSKHNWSTSRTSRHFPQWDPPSQISRLSTFVVIYRCKSKTQLSDITDAFNTYGKVGQAPNSCCDHLPEAHASNDFFHASAWCHMQFQAVPNSFLQKGNGQWSFFQFEILRFQKQYKKETTNRTQKWRCNFNVAMPASVPHQLGQRQNFISDTSTLEKTEDCD